MTKCVFVGGGSGIALGGGVRATARKFGIPKSTVSHWVNGDYRSEITQGGLYEAKKAASIKETNQ